MSRRIWYMEAIVPRCRGVYANGSFAKVPFLNDLYPIENGQGQPTISNDGGRYNIFDATTEAIDQIGEETRELQPDACVENDGVGGGVYLNMSEIIGKWAVAFRIESDGSPIISAIGGTTTCYIGLQQSGYPVYRAGLPSYTRHYFNGDGDTLSTPTDVAGKYTCVMYSDGINVHCYINKLHRGFVTPSDATDILPRLLMRYSSNQNLSSGKYYDYRIWDLTDRTAAEINDYFTVNAPLFHVNNMKEDSNFLYGQWLMNERGGSTAFNSGSDESMPHGTYFYDDVNVPDDRLHNTTLYPTGLKNFANKDGYTDNAGIIIPMDKANPDYDVQGNLLQYKGTAKYNSEVIGGYVGEITTTGVLSFTDLTGVTIISSIGTSTSSISGNNINLTTGEISYLELSNGSILYFNGNTINVLNGVEVPSVGITFKQVLDTTPQSTIDSLSKTVYKDSTGNLIIDPQYPATTEEVLKGKGYKGIGVINNDPIVWDTYTDKDGVEHIDSPNRSENLVVNGDNWIDTDGDGLADDWLVEGSYVDKQYSIVTDSNGIGQKMEALTTGRGTFKLIQDVGNIVTDSEYTIRIKYKSNMNFRVYLSSAQSLGSVPNSLEELSYYDIIATRTSNGTDIIFYMSYNNYSSGDYVIIYDVEVLTSENSNEVGHLPHALGNNLNYEGNSYSDRQYILAANLPHIDVLNPYHDTPEIIALKLAGNWYNAAGSGYVYFLLKDGAIIKRVVYPNQRTQAQNDEIVSKGYLPNYQNL